MRRLCRQNEQCLESLGPCPVFNVVQDSFTISFTLNIRIDNQASHFRHFFGRERIQGGTSENHSIMFDHGEIFDLTLEQFPSAFDERPVLFVGLDQF